METHKIDSDEHYNPRFYKPVAYEILEEYYPLIGQVIASFNSLEDDINEALVDYINNKIDEIGWTIIADMPFYSKLHLWNKLIELWARQDLEINEPEIQFFLNDAQNIFKKINRLSELRNKIVHADWDNMNEKLFAKSKAKTGKKGIEHIYLSINSEEFEKITDQLDEVSKEFYSFNKKFLSTIQL